MIGKLIGFFILIILIVLISWWLYDYQVKADKLLELSCDPEAWNQFGHVTIWSCPAWRGIDVNNPSTFMNQRP